MLQNESMSIYNELKEKFIAEHVAQSVQKEVLAKFELIRDNDDYANHPISFEQWHRDFWSHQYDVEHIHELEMLHRKGKDGFSEICDNGGFEDGFLHFRGEVGRVSGSGSDHCSPNPAVNWVPTALPTTDRLEIVSAGSDAYVPNLQMVRFGNLSARVNSRSSHASGSNCWADFGIDKLIREFDVTSDQSEFTLWYAFVLENPAGHVNQQPFMDLKVIVDDVVVIQSCISGDDPFFDKLVGDCNVRDSVIWRDWDCYNLNLNNYVGGRARLEIVVADCFQGAHSGYAYIDGICEPCQGSVSGDVTLYPIGDCIQFPITVCGQYSLPQSSDDDNLWSLMDLSITISSSVGCDDPHHSIFRYNLWL